MLEFYSRIVVSFTLDFGGAIFCEDLSFYTGAVA
jgi:hypothetical protein